MIGRPETLFRPPKSRSKLAVAGRIPEYFYQTIYTSVSIQSGRAEPHIRGLKLIWKKFYFGGALVAIAKMGSDFLLFGPLPLGNLARSFSTKTADFSTFSMEPTTLCVFLTPSRARSLFNFPKNCSYFDHAWRQIKTS